MVYWPQITVICLYCVNLAVNSLNHGKTRGPYSVWYAITNTVLSIWILNSGGFFNNLK
jgi:hypothetical protein